MMQKTVLYNTVILCFLMCLMSLGTIQAQERCGSDQYMEQLLSDPDFARQFYERQDQIRQMVDLSKVAAPCDNPLIVPVAIHYNNPITDANTSCLIAAAQAQIEQLNLDFSACNANAGNLCEWINAGCDNFGGTQGADAMPEDGACIQFCLGDQALPGGEDNIGGFAITVGDYTWPNVPGNTWDGWLNVFVSDGTTAGLSDPNILGIAPLFGGANPNGNGVYVLNSAFGSQTFNGCTSGGGLDNNFAFNGGGTLTHEIGHYFGLEHTFGDNLADTPPQTEPNSGCPTVDLVNCTSSVGSDYSGNFMDYVNDDCMSNFTADQVEIMQSAAAAQGVWQTGSISCYNDWQIGTNTYPPCGDAQAGACITCDYTYTVDATCAPDETTYTVSVTITGGTGPFNIIESSGTAPETHTGVAAGTYTYTVTAGNNTTIDIVDTGAADCTQSEDIFDPCNPCELQVSLDLDNVTCALIGGEIIPAITFTQTGGIGTVWIDQDGNTTFDAGTDIDMTAGINLGFSGPDLNLIIYDSGNPDCAVNVVAPYGDYSCEGVPEGQPPLVICNLTFDADVANYECNGDGTATVNLTVGDAAGNITFNQTVEGAFPNYTVDVPVGGACSSTFTITVSDDGADISNSAIIEITSPASIAGGINNVGSNSFPDWGIDINTVDPCVSGVLVAPNDGTAPANDFCEPSPPATPSAAQCNGISGNIAVIDRGSCNFTDKVENAQACGAVAVLICNNDTANPDQVINMSGTTTNPVTIPSVSLSYNECQTIYAEMANGDVEMCIGAPVPVPCERTITINTCNFDCEVCDDCADPACVTTRPCDDNDCNTAEDMESVLNDGTICVECAGIPVPPPPCDDDVCTNGGTYVYDTNTCECVIDVATILGCLDPAACNFDDTANCSSDDCVYTTSCDLDPCTNGGTYVWDDTQCACVLDQATIEGCTNPAAPNYVPTANCDDGSCECNPDGCIDPTACNFDDTATCDDGSCIYIQACDADPCTNGGIYAWNETICACLLSEATVEGCTDPAACNFDDTANCSDNSVCVYEEACDTDGCTNGGIYIWDTATCECVLDVATADGCTDPNACNFDDTANCDDGSCIFETACDDDICTNGGIYEWDVNACECVLVDPSVLGCNDPAACNFDDAATCDDGSCIFETACDDDACTNGGTYAWDATTCECVLDVETVEGCNDPAACNFDDTANCDDGSCILETQCNSDCTSGDIEVWDDALCACVPTGDTSVPGCNDPAACNFDDTANCDDGSCIYETACDDDACTNGGVYVWDATTCACTLDMATVEGCNDPAACNFDDTANCDDGSCIFETACDDDVCTNGGTYIWDTATCACVLDIATIEGCTDPNACNFDDTANCNTGCIYETACNTDCLLGDIQEWDNAACACVTIEESFPGCLDPNATNYDATANCDDPSSCVFDIPGCPDATADNYDPAATTDNGTCEYSGCTDATAPNYNPQATVDDGSCLPANPAGCDISFEAINMTQGNQGGISPFYYNKIEVTVIGGTAPYDYAWDAVGYVRNAIVGNGVIRVIHSDNASWCVTITDIEDCQVIVCEDLFNGADSETTTIDIVDSDIESATNFASNGSIDISVGGGTLPYSYQWSNGSASQDIYGVSSGWYSVVVTDADGQMTEGWFWVPNARPGGRGKTEGNYLEVYPNPLESMANIEFSVAKQEAVEITLYTLDGAQVINVYKGQVEAGVANKVSFEAGPIPTGVYLLEMRTESGVSEYQKVVVAK